MLTIYDVGMYDGADTAHYLETGHRVVAVEANPDLAAAGAGASRARSPRGGSWW